MIGRMVYVICDICLRPCGGVDQLRDTAREARQLARSAGWKRTPRVRGVGLAYGQRGVDRCPQCVAKEGGAA